MVKCCMYTILTRRSEIVRSSCQQKAASPLAQRFPANLNPIRCRCKRKEQTLSHIGIDFFTAVDVVRKQLYRNPDFNWKCINVALHKLGIEQYFFSWADTDADY